MNHFCELCDTAVEHSGVFINIGGLDACPDCARTIDPSNAFNHPDDPVNTEPELTTTEEIELAEIIDRDDAEVIFPVTPEIESAYADFCDVSGYPEYDPGLEEDREAIQIFAAGVRWAMENLQPVTS